ncbi:MAG: hypothetical protein M3P27_04550 [Acidobacteriota bacterium]|nr:hypothetical protein [Acidobacteriota bacterium]
MSRSLGFIGLIIVVALGAVIYMKQVQSASSPAAQAEGAGGSPHSTIDVAGIKNDLLSIAQAERAHMASQGRYASLDELVSAGELSMVKTRRLGWTFSTDIGELNFKVMATYSGAAPAGTPTRFVVDETMAVRSE